HVHQVCLIRCCHQDESGKTAQISDVESAGMGWPVRAHQARAIDGEAHRQTLDGNIVHDLVKGPLQERGVDRSERLESFCRKTAGESYGMVFGNDPIEATVRKLFFEQV